MELLQCFPNPLLRVIESILSDQDNVFSVVITVTFFAISDITLRQLCYEKILKANYHKIKTNMAVLTFAALLCTERVVSVSSSNVDQLLKLEQPHNTIVTKEHTMQCTSVRGEKTV